MSRYCKKIQSISRLKNERSFDFRKKHLWFEVYVLLLCLINKKIRTIYDQFNGINLQPLCVFFKPSHTLCCVSDSTVIHKPIIPTDQRLRLGKMWEGQRAADRRMVSESERKHDSGKASQAMIGAHK